MLKYSILILILLNFLGCKENSESFQLTTKVTPEGSGEVIPPDGIFSEDEEVELLAKPYEGYKFTEWSGAIIGNENPRNILINSDKNVTATFEKREYPLNIEIHGNGSISERVISNAKTDYEFGSIVELTAVSSSGWKFQNWSGDLQGNNITDTLRFDSEKNVQATFIRRTYDLNISVIGEGEVNEEVIETPQKGYEFETKVELTPISYYGWEFEKWTGDISSTDSVIQITVDNDLDIVANFKRSNFNLNVNITGEGSLATEVIENRRKSFEYGSYVELTPMPASFWEFTGWGGELSGTTVPEYILLDSSRTVGLEFKRQWKDYYSVEASINDGILVGTDSYVIGEVSSATSIFAEENINGHDGYVLSLNKDKTINWIKTDGGMKGDWFNHLVSLDDESLIIVGQTESEFSSLGNYNGGASDILVYSISKYGTKNWSVLIGGSDREQVNQIIRLPNNEFMITGTSNSSNGNFSNNSDPYIPYNSFTLLMNNAGNIISNKFHGRLSSPLISQMEDSVIFIGRAYSNSNIELPAGAEDLIVAKKLDKNGNIGSENHLTWNNGMDYRSKQVNGICTSDNSTFITGFVGAKPWDYFLAKINNNLELDWINYEESPTDKIGHSIACHNGFIYTTFVDDGVSGRLYLEKLTTNGTSVWVRNISPHYGSSNISSIDIKNDKILITSNSGRRGSGNMHYSKLDLDGNYILLEN